MNVTQRFRQRLPDRASLAKMGKNGLAILLIFGGLYGIGHFVPEGFDWKEFFSRGRFPQFWMPWTKPIVSLLNLPAVFALTVIGIGLRSYRYRASPWAIALGLLSLPTLWLIYLGTLDGLALIGLLILPWGAPLVLIKPQVAGFALLAKRNAIIIAIIWVLISFIIWGFWPLNMGELFQPDWKEEWPQDITLFPWGLIIAIPLMWLSRGDEDLLMAAGSFATPHLFPYHFVVLMPALARMRWQWMLITWLISFTPLLSNWLGPWAWHFGNLMSVCFWLGIYLNRKPNHLLEIKSGERTTNG